MTDHDSHGALAETCRVTTQGMAYGPHAIGHQQGKVLFIRGAAPQETVDVRLREVHRRYAFADVVRVHEPSAARREPPCPYLPRCGGCPWQHLDYRAQLAAKADSVREHLRRIGGLNLVPLPILHSPREFGYRHRLKLRVQQGRVGFYAGGSHELVEITHCLLAAPEIDVAIPVAAELAAQVHTAVQRIELVAAVPEPPNIVVIGESAGPWMVDDDARCRAWMTTNPIVRGLVLYGRGWRRVWGDDRIATPCEPGLQLTVRAGTFTQVNPGSNLLLVATVVRLAAVQPGVRVLDLYAGAGNLSIPLARRGADVVAVEEQPLAVRDGRANAEHCGAETCRFRRARAADALRQMTSAGERFDLVILDPPRGGARAVVSPLLDAAPARVLYVSCDPTSLARDLKQLSSRYRVDVVQPIDMFPHSYHIETVVSATLAC